jgi:starch-binding outer membrane protein, SusD/RagB family
MKTMIRNRGVQAVLALLVASLPGCDTFLDVENPNNLEAENVDADRDAGILSRSAFQSFVAEYGDIGVYQAWFTNEARVGDTFPTRNDFGRRDVSAISTGDNTSRWNNLHSALQFSEKTILQLTPAGNTLDLARAYFTSGYALVIMAETFCQGTLAEAQLDVAAKPRGPLTTVQTLDSAIARLTKANDIAKALTGTEASSIATASIVGIARAHLQAGRRPQASQFAAQVPASFTYNLLHLDDAANRGRLGNDFWNYSESRISLVVGDEWRSIANCGAYMPGDTSCVRPTGADPYRPKATGDPRISYTDMNRTAQDGILRFHRQGKIAGWGSSDRLASGLEAQYIKVEADQNPADMLAFINARRAVGKQAPMPTTTDMNVLMKELMEQRSRDFWLEVKRLGDFRRNPQHVSYIIQPGANTYYKTGVGQVSDQTCWPVPDSEIRNNPEWK